MFLDYLTQARRHIVKEGSISQGHLMSLGLPDVLLPRLTNRLAVDASLSKDSQLTRQGRRLNNFCLGSDPEFAFVNPGTGRKENASSLGLKPALAAGCDQNQRLAELRCWPSSSAVEHVAGVLASLRWMYRLYPHTRQYNWVAGAWYENDGIGGHVHFGRKRPNRASEVSGLDGLATAFKQLRFFNSYDWDKRQKGDSLGQRYGGFGDIRPQVHGYEYRTLPSWLCSPQKAFAVVAASKLAVLDPELVTTWLEAPKETALSRLQALAAYFAGRDDDAWILKQLLARKSLDSITLHASDFKQNWGFGNHPQVNEPNNLTFTACVKPAPSEITEVQVNLLEGTTLQYVENAPTFRQVLPERYVWLYRSMTNGINRSGFGDLMHDSVVHKDHGMTVNYGDRLSASWETTKDWTAEQRRKVKEIYPNFMFSGQGLSGTKVLYVTREMTLVDQIKKLRDFLYKSGLFPIWTIESVQDNSYAVWITAQKNNKTKDIKKIERERLL